MISSRVSIPRGNDPFLHWLTLSLLPLGNCDYCCYERGVQISLQDTVFNFFGSTSRNGIAGLYGFLILIFSGTVTLFSMFVAPFYIPANSAQMFQFLHILTNTCYFPFLFFLYSGFPDGCGLISRCSFALNFLMVTNIKYIFLFLLAICLSLGKCLFWFFAHIFLHFFVCAASSLLHVGFLQLCCTFAHFQIKLF